MAAPKSYDEFIAAQREEGLIPFQAFGRTFHIRTPEVMEDAEVVEFLEIIDSTEPSSVLRLAELAIDDWPAFSAAGGTAMGLAAYMKELLAERNAEARAEQGADLGESEAS